MDYSLVIASWVSDCLERDISHRESFGDLYGSYLDYTTSLGWQVWPSKSVSLGLMRIGAVRSKSGGRRYFVGFKIKRP